MLCGDLLERLEDLSPTSYALSWDNVGLLAGRRDKEIERVIIALDATDDVVAEAVEWGADLLLTHHPLIFKARKTINDGDFIGRRLLDLLRNDICYYAMHTNFDVMGMADAVADELGLSDRSVLDVTYEDDISKEGIGRVGSLPRGMDVTSLSEKVKQLFDIERVKVFGDLERLVERVAVCPGSGSSVIGRALAADAEVLITGDIDHHAGLDAMAEGLTIIDAGHYGLEHIFASYMEDFLKREVPEIKLLRAAEQAPFRYI